MLGHLSNSWHRRLFFALLALSLSAGCSARRDNAHVRLDPPREQTSVGPGDVFQVQVVGEKDLPTEYQVASDGTIEFPYLQTLKVAGLEPQEIARLIRDGLIANKILTEPDVVVTVKEYKSKNVTLLGQVQKPGSFPFSAGMTLIQAISMAGGLTSIANNDRVNLTRNQKDGTARTVVVSVEAITEGYSPDIPLQAGDRIFVHQRIF